MLIRILGEWSSLINNYEARSDKLHALLSMDGSPSERAELEAIRDLYEQVYAVGDELLMLFGDRKKDTK